jgi:aflatoxin B1 aldehyde reductase
MYLCTCFIYTLLLTDEHIILIHYCMSRERFWKGPLFEALEELRKLCSEHNTTLTAASLRWLLHNSALSAQHGDACIIGGSTPEQAAENIAACAEGALPAAVVQQFDVAWTAAKADCPSYFR